MKKYSRWNVNEALTVNGKPVTDAHFYIKEDGKGFLILSFSPTDEELAQGALMSRLTVVFGEGEELPE